VYFFIQKNAKNVLVANFEKQLYAKIKTRTIASYGFWYIQKVKLFIMRENVSLKKVCATSNAQTLSIGEKLIFANTKLQYKIHI